MSQLEQNHADASASRVAIKIPTGSNPVEDLDQLSFNQLVLLDQQYRETLSQKKRATERKQIQSKHIGDGKKRGEDVSTAIEGMQQLSQQLKTIDRELKALKKKALSLVNPEHQAELNSDNGEPITGTNQPVKFCRAVQPTSLSMQDVVISEISSTAANADDINAWQEYVSKQKRCSIYHQYVFRTVIDKTMGHNSHYLIARDANKQVKGIFPAIELNSRLFGHSLVSIPFFNYGGPIAEDESIENLLITAMAKIAKTQGAESIEIRDAYPRKGYPVKDHKVSMLLALPDSAESLWKGIGSKVRAQVKKADEHQPSIRFGKKELLSDFYQVFAINMRDLGTPVYGKSFFESIITEATDAATLAVVYINNQPVSCAFLLGDKDTLEIPWASTLRKANRSNANMHMYWKILEFACNHGYAYFDFGRSSKEASTYKFKKQWGAKALPLYWHYWLNENQDLPQVNPDNPKFRLLINVWRRLPVWLTKIIGPLVVKYIP